MVLDEGTVPVAADTIFVDATANGLARLQHRPVFDGDVITLQPVVMCQQVYSAAFVAHLEARFDDDATKNALSVPIPHPTDQADFLRAYRTMFRNEIEWSKDPELVQWRQDARLAGLTTRVGTPLPGPGEEREQALTQFRAMSEVLLGRTVEMLDAWERTPSRV